MKAGLQRRLRLDSAFSRKVAQAGFWASALRLVVRASATIRILILAAILAPGDFGLMGIALLTMSFLTATTQTGLAASLIQQEEDIRPSLDTVWTLEFLRGLGLCLLLVLIAPAIGGFFDTPEATPIIRVMAIVLLINGLNNVGTVYFEKDLEFRRLFVYQMARVVAEMGVGIGVALALHSVWALVYSALAGGVAQLVFSYLLHPYRPRPRLEPARFTRLYGFGKWVWGFNFLAYAFANLADLVVGKMLGTTSLGWYRMANNLSQSATGEIALVTSKVAFPAYSQLQGNMDGLRQAYLKTENILAVVSFPLASALLYFVPSFTQIFLGEKWMPMVPAFQILVIREFVRTFSASGEPLFLSVGRPDLITKLVFLRVVGLCVLVYPFTAQWGLVGTATAVVASTLLSSLPAIFIAVRMVSLPWASFGKAFVYPVLITGCTLAALFAIQAVGNLQANLASLIVLPILGGAFYLAGVLVSNKFLGYSVGGLLART